MLIIITIQFIGIVIRFCYFFYVFVSQGFGIRSFVSVCLCVPGYLKSTSDTTQHIYTYTYNFCGIAGPARYSNFSFSEKTLENY